MAPQLRGPRLERNKYGTWEIRWSDNRRSMRRSTGETDRSAAELKLAEFLTARGQRAKTVGALKVGQALDDYMREHVEDGVVVDKGRQRAIVANLRPFFGAKACRDLSPADTQQYQQKRRTGTTGSKPAKSNGTLRRELNTLIAAMNHAVRTRRLPAGEVPYIPLPEAPGAKDFWLNEEEARQLLVACDVEGCRGALFIRIALATAARRRSIETLTWGQVDFAARRIQFNPPGRRQTAKRRVALPISAALLPHLQAAYALRYGGLGREDVHVARHGDFVLGSSKAITKRLDAVCRRAFVATGNSRFLLVTPHTLRHTAATLMARAGIPIYQVAGLLGDTIQTCTKNYLHHCPEHLREAANVLGAVMSGKPTVTATPHPVPPDRGALHGAQSQELRATAPDTDQHAAPKAKVISW